ncbi:hypothetical protein KAU11_10585 [Candidatus Babeliales bacterium]|nr:hypothetical protein [Candidatus Babeliales bacterium]
MNLFYSGKEQVLFNVAGYCEKENVKENIESLTKGAEELASLAGVTIDKVYSFKVLESRRYKRMTVFYVKTETIPEEAFKIGEDWSMVSWLKN